MKKIIYLIGLCFVGFVVSCSKKPKINVLQLKYISNSEISIISDADLIWNPFGDLSSLQKSSNGIFKIKESVVLDSVNGKVVIKNLSFSRSFVKVAVVKDQYELLAAEIRDPEISLVCQIKIGMSKLDFFKMITNEPEMNSLKSFNTIFISDPLGESVTEKFLFKNDQLNEIIFKTEDYHFKNY
ncbi:MAG TPA: hypothetical protein VGQ59_17970 [Cyclobacteriaceae bacterium]|jgi:hypothetical protein|nr:hypothetical protein [Cyclobacteriaceae bacterium]